MPSFFDINGDPTMDPYTILLLPPTATEAEVKKAYRMQMLQLHPDKLSPTLGDDSIAAVTEKFHNVKDAYEFLVNPMHLASRRLYMAKMASRRADYERREAFLRRKGGKGDDYTAYNARGGGVSGYRSGGGGAAGMAGTGMPPPQQRPSTGHDGNANNNSYPVRPKKHRHRSKSEADFAREGRDDGHGRDHHRGGGQRRSSMGGNGTYKNASRGRPPKGAGQHQASKRKYNNNKGGGYKSDTTANKAKSHSAREGRSHRPRNKNNGRQQQRQRTRSEPRHRREKYESEGEKRTSNNKDNRRSNRTDQDREAAAARARSQRRRRAKSAPARSQTRSKNNKAAASIMKDRDLPRHFFCPLTKRLMKDPVTDTEGNIYDREAIERWLRVQNSSPITNGYLSLDMLKPDRELKRAIYKATGKPRSKSQTRTKPRSNSPAQDLVSGRVLVDSYLREISSKSKLSVSLDGMGICAFSYRRITFVIEVPITPHAGFMVYSSFDGEGADRIKLCEKMDAWNQWLANIGRQSRVLHVRAGQKTVFTLKGSEGDMSRCDVFQKMLEYFVEMSLKLHNLMHPTEAKVVENVCLTRSPVGVT